MKDFFFAVVGRNVLATHNFFVVSSNEVSCCLLFFSFSELNSYLVCKSRSQVHIFLSDNTN